jgi:beta-galactosidase GanA
VRNDTSIEVFAPSRVSSLLWNNREIQFQRTEYGSLIGHIEAPSTKHLVLPELSSWKSMDSLPERFSEYNDKGPAWVPANHTTTPNPTKPDTLPVLYIDDYGFHSGSHLWRGYFNGPAKGVSLSVQGGMAFGWSAWLNGAFVGSFLGGAMNSTGNLTLSFDNATVYANKSNVLLVLQDNNGHELRAEAITPRGILSAVLVGGGNFSNWRVAGKAGGQNTVIDPVRGDLNEGGLTAERLGWHLPGFDDGPWTDTASPSTGFSGPGVQFYRTVVPLDVPDGLDISLSFVLRAPASQKIRVQLFVNGYQYGRFNPWIGHQVDFPVPPGILNYRGPNTIALSVWSQSMEKAQVSIGWKLNYALDSSFDSKFDSSYLRPGWTDERLKYA